MPVDPEQTTTIVFSRSISAGREQDFDAWVEELYRLARAAPAYRAAIRLGQTAGFQHLLFRFENARAAELWQEETPVKAHIAIADSFSTALSQTRTGDNVRFELPSDASASKWKRFLTTWLAVFPVLLVVSLAFRMLLKDVPQPLQLLPSSLLLTATLQWIILPKLQRYTRTWLLQGSSGELKT